MNNSNLNKSLSNLALVLALFCVPSAMAEIRGHTKLQYQAAGIPEDSVFYPSAGSVQEAISGDLRLNWNTPMSRNWSFDVAYDLWALNGDQLFDAVIGDDRSPLSQDRYQLWDLTKEIRSSNDGLIYHRLDRVSVGYQDSHLTLKFGRQAVSWGNGLFFNPMDVVSPFNPLAIDTEYKTGTDMLYGQYLYDSGADLEFMQIMRRDDTGELNSEAYSYAVKYHQLVSMSEMELFAAQHYDEMLLGGGFTTDIGSALARVDVVWTDASYDAFVSVVSNLSYSWMGLGKNMSGAVEYFYSGIGVSGGDLNVDAVLSKPGLADRLARGELFTLGRHYVGMNWFVEAHPLWNINTNIILNADDASGVFQLMNIFDLSEDTRVTAVVGVPLGGDDGEFTGLEVPGTQLYLSQGWNIFIQFAWYF